MKRMEPAERGTLDAAREALDYSRDWYVDSQAVMAKFTAIENAIDNIIEYLERNEVTTG